MPAWDDTTTTRPHHPSEKVRGSLANEERLRGMISNLRDAETRHRLTEFIAAGQIHHKPNPHNPRDEVTRLRALVINLQLKVRF